MLSIIIPVLNEAATIEKSLGFVVENLSGKNDVEIIIADGGSKDGTKDLVEKFISEIPRPPQFLEADRSFSIKFIYSKKGRAKQMNFGARHSKGEILYFLHADSFPPINFDKHILYEIDKGNLAGCFRMKFDSNHWWLQLAGWFTKFNVRGFRGGDQSQFITKTLFEEIGGFDENYIIYEDNILIAELYKRDKFVVIPHILTTSARRYQERGIWNLQYHFWMVHLKKRFGADAGELYRYYKNHIGNKDFP